MSRQCRVVFFFSLLLVELTCNLQSQIAQDHHPWWVNLGGGPSIVGSSFTMGAGMVYSYQFGNSLMSGRILGLTNKNPTVQQIDPTTVEYKMADYGILYGPIWHYRHSYFSFGAGIGLVRAAYETTAGITTNSSISLPIEAQGFWQPTNFVGFGVYTFASLNFEKQLYGIMLCAQLGMW